ncbi:hypothetical protein A4A49_53536 [Nicotiana attenuata]|uniref:Putative plant transposon protein domain-containing protein n=1 Tax=Nicotiana attenuata TaxID=49451 RepID=A0A1J6JYU8_NICAT|nr:hypothetical protein A4A49_53536 [Nicotiana attenuata]
MPPRNDTGKGKATSTDQAKAKSTSAPPPKKRKGGEAASSMNGCQAVAAVDTMRPQPPGQREFGINSIPPHMRDWYKHCRPKHIHPEGAIQERSVKAKYPAIWKGIQDLGLSYVFKNTGDINLNLVREFYVWFDPLDTEELVPIRGRLIDFSAKAICDFLGAPNVPMEPLEQFISRPTYRELRHTLCGVDSIDAWFRYKETNRHKRFPKKKTKAEAEVWLKLNNARLLPCNNDTLVSRVRTCVIYFLMTGQRVHVGHLIPHQMASVRTTHPTNRHLYGMMDLQLRIGGRPATFEERTELPADEDVNTPEQSDAEPIQSDGEEMVMMKMTNMMKSGERQRMTMLLN